MAYFRVELPGTSFPIEHSQALRVVGDFMQQTFPSIQVRKYGDTYSVDPKFADGTWVTVRVMTVKGLPGDRTQDQWVTVSVSATFGGNKLAGTPRERQDAERFVRECSTAIGDSLQSYILNGRLVVKPLRLPRFLVETHSPEAEGL